LLKYIFPSSPDHFDTSLQLQPSVEEGLEFSHPLQASPIRPRRFGVGPARGTMKGKDADKPVLHLHWPVSSCSHDLLSLLNYTSVDVVTVHLMAG